MNSGHPDLKPAVRFANGDVDWSDKNDVNVIATI